MGTDNIPVAKTTMLDIAGANTPESIMETGAEHAVGLMIAMACRIVNYDRTVRNGPWNSGLVFPKTHLRGRALGLVGFGRITQAVAQMAFGFSMTVLASDPMIKADAMTAQGVNKKYLDTLISESDFVSVHTPMLKSTRHLAGKAQLKRMRPQTVLVNTARGPIIDEVAIIRALREELDRRRRA